MIVVPCTKDMYVMFEIPRLSCYYRKEVEFHA